MTGVTVLPVTGVGEVAAGDDLAALLAARAGLEDSDVLVVTSKAVSKAEGRVVRGDRESALAGETARMVATRGPTAIVRTRHGLVMAAAGIDASNTPAGTVVLLPEDPDASARALRERLAEATGRNVAVVVSDTSGRAWRTGQTDIAIGAAGLDVLHDYAGRVDGHGNELAVTAPAVADEVAGAADLVKGKLSGVPAAVLRGLPYLVLPVGRHGPGARALVRDEASDLFGYGAREAVARAAAGDQTQRAGFGAAGTVEEVVAALEALLGAGSAVVTDGAVELRLPAGSERELGRLEGRAAAVAFAHGWDRGTGPDPGSSSFRPMTT
jgi:coenzyme F420-0:L-glutamate ligase/coenzyme F420-1:gamma-L-glutamate ligase